MKIRAELERMVLKDLLGPVGGAEEEIDEPSVRDRYLVGMLAPKRQVLSPEEFDELPQGGSGPVEDGTAESTSPANKTMFPSSFGMTFCVGLDTRALQITARWGHYRRDRSETKRRTEEPCPDTFAGRIEPASPGPIVRAFSVSE
jgi:hypothetical protein